MSDEEIQQKAARSHTQFETAVRLLAGIAANSNIEPNQMDHVEVDLAWKMAGKLMAKAGK